MSNLLSSEARVSFRRNAVVAPGDDLMGVQAPDGSLIPCERLGPGLVEEVSPEGKICVRWVAADFEAWLEPQDLRFLGDHAHLIVVNRCDGSGKTRLVRHMVITGSGFDNNWTIELRPKNVVRTIRSDGHAWTFTYNPIFRRLGTTGWTYPPDDDDAEAFTAAELSLLKRS